MPNLIKKSWTGFTKPVRACKDIENDARLRDIQLESYAKYLDTYFNFY